MAEEMEVVGTKPTMGEDRSALRSAVLADLAAAPAEPEAPAAPAESPEPAAPAEPAEDETGAPATEGPEPEEPTEPDAEAPTPPAEATPDPELSKRLEALQQAERRKLDAIDKRFRELEARDAEMEKKWAPRLEEIQRFDELKKRAKYDPAAALAALGLDPDADFELAARQIYSRTAAARENPQLRAEAERAMREREQASSVSALEKKIEALTQQITERDQRAQNERLVTEYLSKSEKAVGEETPIVRNMLAKNAERTRHLLGTLAEDIYQRTGEVPDPPTLVRELESRRRAELEESGVDVATVFKNTKSANPAAGEKRNGRTTLSSELTTPTKPRTEPPTREELRAETLRALASGQLE